MTQTTTIDRAVPAVPPFRVPSAWQALSSLLRADFTTLVRNRRSVVMAMLLPTVILLTWRGVADEFGGAFALASAITVGLGGTGLLGYTNAIARDRERGVFQRLRVAPAPTWAIMLSRIVVQLVTIALTTVTVFVVGALVDQITLTPMQYVVTLIAAILSGAVYLAVGQAIVGLVTSAEAVNATTRFVFFPFILAGAFGELGLFGDVGEQIVRWSPYGVVKQVLQAAMTSGGWTGDTSIAVLVALVYTAIFAGIGIRWFRWTTA